MAMATTGERLKEALEARNYKQVDVVRKAKPLCEKYGRQLKKNALSQYIHDKVEPRRDMIALLAEALNVDDADISIPAQDVDPEVFAESKIGCTTSDPSKHYGSTALFCRAFFEVSVPFDCRAVL